MLCIIAAIDNNNAIGFENALLYQIPQDMCRFKKLTLNKTVVMGSKTYESLKLKPLPKRRNIVLSRRNIKTDAIVCKSIDELKKIISLNDEVFVIGGESIYRQLLQYCQKAYITRIYSTAEKYDSVFPELGNSWKKTYSSKMYSSDNLDFRYITYINTNPKEL